MQKPKLPPAAVVLAVVCLGLLSACATLSPATVGMQPGQADGTNLISADPYFLKPAAEWQATMSWISIPFLNSWIDTKLLKASNYDAWRTTRMASASDVQAIVIHFATQLMPGIPDRQSGMLFLPAARSDRKVPVSWIVWCKGTELIRNHVPSHYQGAETAFAATLASLGYAVWMPDYAGMGDSPGIQPYCVPQSLAYSAVDGLAAARAYLKQNSQFYSETGMLHILGYSEGGLTAMATLREIANHPQTIAGLRLATVYSMAAPLNLVTDSGGKPLNNTLVMRPEYSVLIVLGWARAYPDQIHLTDILKPEIIAKIVPLFDGNHNEESLRPAIAQVCSKTVGQISLGDLFRADYLEQVRIDQSGLPLSRLQLAERMDRTTPPAGTNLVLAATPADRIVDPANSLSAYEWLQASPQASQVRLIKLASSDHISAGAEGLLYAIQQIDQETTALVARP